MCFLTNTQMKLCIFKIYRVTRFLFVLTSVRYLPHESNQQNKWIHGGVDLQSPFQVGIKKNVHVVQYPIPLDLSYYDLIGLIFFKTLSAIIICLCLKKNSIHARLKPHSSEVSFQITGKVVSMDIYTIFQEASIQHISEVFQNLPDIHQTTLAQCGAKIFAFLNQTPR